MTLDFIVSPLTEIMQFRDELKQDGKFQFSNFFGLSDNIPYQMAKAPHSMLVRHKEHDFYRLCAVTTDLEELKELLLSLDENVYALNIPSKKDISEQQSFLESCGFSLAGIYNRYYNKNIVVRENASGTFAKKEDLDDIIRLLFDNFSVYTDHLPAKDEIGAMIERQQIVVNRFPDGKVGGLVIHTFEKNIAYINAWIDKTGNGIPLMFQTYNIIADKGISYAYFWINAANKSVIVLHRMMGAKADGLVDYTFVKHEP